MSDIKELGKLAKAFTDAVNADSMKDMTLAIDLFDVATEDELFTVIGLQMEEGADGKLTPPKNPSPKDCLSLAELFSTFAARSGKTEELKKFVPAAARTDEVRTALAKQAPAFAKLCA